MKTETQNEVVATALPKSKRLSSLIWILVLWGFVRLIAGMDGISWTRAFGELSVDFGLEPATVLLLLAVIFDRNPHQQIFRWSTLLMVIGSYTCFWIKAWLNFGEWIQLGQWTVVVSVFLLSRTKFSLKGRNHD
jgi:hypothetical protein